MTAVRRIDRDQHGADPRGGKLQQHPLRAIGRPHGDVLLLFYPQAQQRPGHLVDLVVEFGIGAAMVGLPEGQRRPFRMAAGRVAQHLADRDSIDLGGRNFGHAGILETISDLGNLKYSYTTKPF